jgi:hypothetical protein
LTEIKALSLEVVVEWVEVFRFDVGRVDARMLVDVYTETIVTPA